MAFKLYEEWVLLESLKNEIPSIISEAVKNAGVEKEKALSHFISNIPGGVASEIVANLLQDIAKDQKMLSEFIEGLHSKTNPEKIVSGDYDKPGSVGYKLFQLEPAGIGKGEFFLAWLIKDSILQGGKESFDMQIGKDKYEVKNYRGNVDGKGGSASIRVGVKGKITQFDFFSELIDTIRIIEKLKGRFNETKFNFEKIFDKKTADLLTIIIERKNEYLRGEINKSDFKTLKEFYSEINQMDPKIEGYTNVIFRGPNQKPVEMSIAPIIDLGGGTITINPSTEDNSLTYVITELRRIKYIRSPNSLEEDLQKAVDKTVGDIPYIVFRPSTINITKDFVFDRVSGGGIYIIERSQTKK